MKSTVKRIGWLAVAVLAGGIGPGMAGSLIEPGKLSATFSGMTLDGVYADGTNFTETYGDDGSIRYHDVDRSDSGTWTVRGDTFCTFYESAKGACFYVERDGANCFTFLNSVDRHGSPAPADKWTSRGWDRAHPSTCPKPPEASI
jgi:hypothetical protein